MELEFAIEDENSKMKKMLNPNTYAAPAAAPLAQQKGMGEQFGEMAKQKAMAGALEAGTGALTTAGTSALGGSAMAGLGTAVPYVGAGLLAGKALGLFNQGGQVGPLSAQYHAEGTNEDYLGTSMPPEILQNLINMQQPKLDYSKIGSSRGGFTEEQAMALMNNKPAIDRPNPDELYNEIMAESMTESAQKEMPVPIMRAPLRDPYGSDRTYGESMYESINT